MTSTITHAQKVAFAILPKVSGFLSMMGSAFVIQDIVRDPAKQQRTYGRLLLGFSMVDFVASFMYFLSTWPIPANEPPLFASGSMATCTAQGFFVQMSIAAPVYSLGLAAYYYLILVKNWQDCQLKEFEKYVHGLAIVLGAGTAVAGLPLKLYNNSNLWCWISSLPMNCEGGMLAGGGTGPCLRGQSAWIYRWAFYYAPLWATILAITITMAYVTRHVCNTEARSRKWRLGNNNLQSVSDRVFWQSVEYVLAFYITWIFPTTMRLLQTFDIDPPVFVRIGMCICLPLQGFWNAAIYVKPRFRKMSITAGSSKLATILSQTTTKVSASLQVSKAASVQGTSRAHSKKSPTPVEGVLPCVVEDVEGSRVSDATQPEPSIRAPVAGHATPSQDGFAEVEWDPSHSFQRLSLSVSMQHLQTSERGSRELTSTMVSSALFDASSTSHREAELPEPNQDCVDTSFSETDFET